MHHKLPMIILFDNKVTDQRNKAIYDVIGAVPGSNPSVLTFQINYLEIHPGGKMHEPLRHLLHFEGVQRSRADNHLGNQYTR